MTDCQGRNYLHALGPNPAWRSKKQREALKQAGFNLLEDGKGGLNRRLNYPISGSNLLRICTAVQCSLDAPLYSFNTPLVLSCAPLLLQRSL